MPAREGTDSFEYLTVESREDVALVMLNRPERLNALSIGVVDELSRLMDDLNRSESTNVVVLTGVGRAFCAGIDLKEGVGERSGSNLDDMSSRYRLQRRFSKLVADMRAIPQPLIAAVHGPAVGGGLSLAAACDIRIADETAVFSAAFLRVGLTGGDMGTSFFLPRAMGRSAASELLYTGRDFNADEALRLQFVSRVVEPGTDVDAAYTLAAEIAKNSPLGVRLTKESVNASLGGGLGASLTIENRAQVLCMFTEAFEDAMDAFKAKAEGDQGEV